MDVTVMEWLCRIIRVELTGLFAESSVELELDHETYKVPEIIICYSQLQYKSR